jgi:hypothetical protein
MNFEQAWGASKAIGTFGQTRKCKSECWTCDRPSNHPRQNLLLRCWGWSFGRLMGGGWTCIVLSGQAAAARAEYQRDYVFLRDWSTIVAKEACQLDCVFLSFENSPTIQKFITKENESAELTFSRCMPPTRSEIELAFEAIPPSKWICWLCEAAPTSSRLRAVLSKGLQVFCYPQGI